jgi:hypothetical protein
MMEGDMGARALLLVAMLSIGSSGCWLPEPFQRLDYQVVDAEYSQSLKLVVMVSASPATLHLYDPTFRRDDALSLPADPTCVGLSPDGRFAAVGYDHSVSYVDLGAEAILGTYSVSGHVSDIVLADNGQIYAMLDSGITHPGFSVIDIASGVEQVLGNGGTWAKQRPNGENLYVTNGDAIPQALSSYSISGGGASSIHLSPNTGLVSDCWKLWFSDDGQRLFTGCGDTLRASSSRDQDMRYTGTLSNAGHIQELSHSSSAQHVIAIPSGNFFGGDPLADTKLQLYHDAYLEYRGSKPLPPFVVDGQTVAAHGRFVFFDDSGRYYIVIQQADSSAGLQHDFAIFEARFAPSSFTGATGPPPSTLVQAFPTFDYPVEDAEYDAALDRIVYVSSDPNTLHILDPETGADAEVPLPFAPNSVSINLAGDRAAVGHDGGSVSLVDLASASLLENYPVSGGDILDTVLTENWVYAFPRGTGSGFLRAIELATGNQETAAGPVSGDSRAKLDSTGTKLYVADNWESPSTLALFDASQHPAKYVWKIFPYPPSPQICGDLWMSQSGLRIFTRCGGVYHSSTNPAVDMTVEGRLQGLTIVRHLSDSAASGTISAIPAVPDYSGFGFTVIPGGGWDGDPLDDTRVELFDASSFSLKQTIAIPPFVLGGSSYPARGRFVFFNGLGTRIYVIVEADAASGLVNGFGIESFDLQ